MKIGLVSPYVYPLPGGVTQHVRHLYENLRLRGHDVRIVTSSHGLQRASEGDIIRLGKGFSMPSNGSVGTLTVSPRYRSQVQEMLDRERFDLLHFHEPLVPFLSPIVLRESHSVNIATFHAYSGFSPAYELTSRLLGPIVARLHGRIAVSARLRAISSIATSRATTRSSPTASTSTSTAGRSRSPAGRTGPTTSCSSAATSRARGCWTF